MRITTIGLLGFFLSPLASLAQDVSIVSPSKDATITPGQKLNVVLQMQGSTSTVIHLSFSTAFRITSKKDETSLGRPYVGTVNPKTDPITNQSTNAQPSDVVLDPSKGTFSYQIDVPPAKDFLDGFSAPYDFTVYDTYLLGATFTPVHKLLSVQVNVQNNNSTSGGGSSPGPDGGKSNNNSSSTNSSGGNNANGSSANVPVPNGSDSNSSKPTSGAAGIPTPVYSIFALGAAYLLLA